MTVAIFWPTEWRRSQSRYNQGTAVILSREDGEGCRTSTLTAVGRLCNSERVGEILSARSAASG